MSALGTTFTTEMRGPKPGKAYFSGELDRLGVDGLDVLDERNELREQGLVGRVHHAGEGEDDVVGGDRGAVVELGTVAEGHLVGGGVDLLGVCGGEGVVRLAGGRVQFDEAFEDVQVGGQRRGARRRTADRNPVDRA